MGSSDGLPFGLILGREQATGGYRCSEQYEWQNLTLRQREQATTEQPQCGSTLKYPLHAYIRDSAEGNAVAIETSHLFRRHDLHALNDRSCNRSFRVPEAGLVALSHNAAEIKKHFAKWNQPLDQTGLLESKRRRRSTSPSYCVKSYPFGSKNGGYHGQGCANLHSPKCGKRSLSPSHASISFQWTEKKVPSLDRVCDYSKRADRHTRAAVRHREFLSSYQGSSTQNRHYQEDQHQPTKVDFSNVHFSEIDKARHRSYMETFRTYSKHVGYCSDHTSVRQTCHSVEVGGANTKEFDEFPAIHHEQLHLSPCDNFHDHLDSSQDCRNAYNGKTSRRQCARQGSQEKEPNGAFVSRSGVNSNQERHGNQLYGQRAKDMPSENQSKNLYLKEQDWRSYPHGYVCHSGYDVLRNDNQEGNTQKIMKRGQNGTKGNSHPKKIILTSSVCSDSKCNEKSGMLGLSEGSNNVTLESEKQPNLTVFTKKPQDMKGEKVLRGKPHVAPVTYVEEGVIMEESDDTSLSALRRDCLILWRRLKKGKCAEAENFVQTDRKGRVQTRRISISGRLYNGKTYSSSESDDENGSTSGSVSVSSERNDENNSSSENSKQCGGELSSGEVLKCRKGRVERESEQPFKSLSGNNSKKGPQNTIAEQGLMRNLDLQSEANPCAIMQQKEQDIISCWSGCSGTSRVEPIATPHPVNSVDQKVCQHGAINDHLDARRKYETVVICETKRKIEGDGVKGGEQISSLSAVPILLDKKAVVPCSMHVDNMKVSVSKCSNQDSEITPMSATKLDKGTVEKLQEKSAKFSTGNNCRDIQWGAMDCNLLGIKQVCSQFEDSEQNMQHKESRQDCGPPQALKVASNERTSHQSDSDKGSPCNASRAD